MACVVPNGPVESAANRLVDKVWPGLCVDCCKTGLRLRSGRLDDGCKFDTVVGCGCGAGGGAGGDNSSTGGGCDCCAGGPTNCWLTLLDWAAGRRLVCSPTCTDESSWLWANSLGVA